MAEIEGLWEYELEKIIHKLKGGTATIRDNTGQKVQVHIEEIDPGRYSDGSDEYM